MAAYEFRVKKIIYNFVLLTMMVPSVLGIIGYMQEMRVLHLSGDSGTIDIDLVPEWFWGILDNPIFEKLLTNGISGKCAYRWL